MLGLAHAELVVEQLVVEEVAHRAAHLAPRKGGRVLAQPQPMDRLRGPGGQNRWRLLVLSAS